eukprot:10914657-Heterocapsa_arctica.AAC.1
MDPYRARNQQINLHNRVETINDLSYAEYGQKYCSDDREAKHNGGENRHNIMHHRLKLRIGSTLITTLTMSRFLAEHEPIN